MDTRRPAVLDIDYVLDKGLVPPVGGLQAITRSRIVFEYLYKNFEIVSSEEHADGHYILRPRRQRRDAAMEPMKFSILPQLVNSGTLKLNAPSTCGLVQLE